MRNKCANEMKTFTKKNRHDIFRQIRQDILQTHTNAHKRAHRYFFFNLLENEILDFHPLLYFAGLSILHCFFFYFIFYHSHDTLCFSLSGCAFVTFTARQMAQSAIKSMHQSQTMEVNLNLKYCQQKQFIIIESCRAF